MQKRTKLSIVGANPHGRDGLTGDSLSRATVSGDVLNVELSNEDPSLQSNQQAVTMPGLENSKIVDIVTPNRPDNTVELWLVQTRSWAEYSAGTFLRQLEDKFNSYLDFCLDGFLFEHYPQYRSMTPKLVLVHFEALPESVAKMSAAFANFVGQHALLFEARPTHSDICRNFVSRASNVAPSND